VTEADQAIAERLASEVLPVQEPGYLGERIAATRNWLKTADAGRYSIQLMHIGIDRGAGLEASLRKGGLGGELERVWVYRTRIRGQELWSVLLGEYSSYEEARQVIQGLPRGLQAARPFVRPLGEVRGAAGIPGEGV
jgi:DamX protein